MNEKDRVRLRHMLDSTEAILFFVEGKERQDLDQDRLLLSGIVREFEILGEAAGAVTETTKLENNSIPWKQLNGMRNRLIHAYFDVNNDIIWKTIMEELPSLKEKIKRALKIA